LPDLVGQKQMGVFERHKNKLPCLKPNG